MEHVMAQWDSVIKSATESGKALEAINLKLVEQLTKKQVDLVACAFETSNKWVSSFGESKALPELMSVQSKLASEYSAKFVATVRETADLLASSRDEYKVWLEKGSQTFSAQAEAVAAKPATNRKAA